MLNRLLNKMLDFLLEKLVAEKAENKRLSSENEKLKEINEEKDKKIHELESYNRYLFDLRFPPAIAVSDVNGGK